MIGTLYEVYTFEDDTGVFTKHSRLQSAVYNLQEATDELAAWFRKWRLTLNPSKTEAKIFGLRMFTNEDTPELQVDQLPVHWTPKDQGVRYLGVYFDTRLNWTYHVNRKLQHAHNRLTSLYPLINRNTTLRSDCVTLLYKSLILPILTYACPVWLGTSNTTIKRLQTLQNKVLRMAVNAPWFVRNEQLHRELGVDPIAVHIEDLTLRHHERLSTCSGAIHYNLGRPTPHRLKPRLYQHILL